MQQDPCDFYALHTCSENLCGLQLRDWAVVGPSCFHCSIIAFRVGWDKSSRVDISQTNLCQRWYRSTGPHLKSLSSVVGPILLPVFVYRGCMLDFKHLLANGVGQVLRIIRRCVHILLAKQCIIFFVQSAQANLVFVKKPTATSSSSGLRWGETKTARTTRIVFLA